MKNKEKKHYSVTLLFVCIVWILFLHIIQDKIPLIEQPFIKGVSGSVAVAMLIQYLYFMVKTDSDVSYIRNRWFLWYIGSLLYVACVGKLMFFAIS